MAPACVGSGVETVKSRVVIFQYTCIISQEEEKKKLNDCNEDDETEVNKTREKN